MSVFAAFSILVALVAIFSVINHRVLGLPPTIGVMILALGLSLGLIAAGEFSQGVRLWAIQLIGHIDFDRLVLHGMLAFLLFAGALFLDLGDLARDWVSIGLLSVVGTAVSTLIVGLLSWGMLGFLHLDVPLAECFLFGALISPTDPIAVLAIMRKVGAPKTLEVQIAGESLFNDGIGVVIFLTFLEIVHGSTTPTIGKVALLLVQEAGGGTGLGLLLGLITYRLLKPVDEHRVEILLTLALAMGGYALADALHVSAPIFAVVAGLFIGNHGRSFAMSKKSRERVDTFWELIDEFFNALLFLMLGLEMLVMRFDARYVAAGALAIVIVLGVRWASVAGIIAPLRRRQRFVSGTIRVLTWGGLRGGLSVAMVLSLPAGKNRDLLMTMTYVVVVFSIIIQGLTVGPLVRRVCTRNGVEC